MTITLIPQTDQQVLTIAAYCSCWALAFACDYRRLLTVTFVELPKYLGNKIKELSNGD